MRAQELNFVIHPQDTSFFFDNCHIFSLPMTKYKLQCRESICHYQVVEKENRKDAKDAKMKVELLLLSHFNNFSSRSWRLGGSSFIQ
jgi:hypothetical protein